MRKVCTLILVVMSVFSFSESAFANAGMNGGSAFSKWMKVSKGSGEKDPMGMTRSKKMKRMEPMKTGMRKMGKNMSDILGEMGDMGTVDSMWSSDSMSTDKMGKNKKMGTAPMKSPKMTTMDRTDSIISMAGDKKMAPKMKKKMRKKMGKDMKKDPAMDKKKDEMPKEEEKKSDEGAGEGM